MKGIILAGGTGSRLGRLTSVLNKHLVAIGPSPMIEYPLKTLVSMGIQDYIVVTGSDHAGTIINYLTKEHPEINFTYMIQKEAGGIAQALSLTEHVCRDSKLAVILGDNIFQDSFGPVASEFDRSGDGAVLFLKKVSDPERFGIAEIKDGVVVRLIEKPKEKISDLAVTGLYFYGPDIFDKIRRLRRSARGEYEITEANDFFVQEKRCRFEIINGFWSDAGTHESRRVAEEFVYSSLPANP